MYKIKITQQHIDFLKKIQGKYAIDPKIEETMNATNPLPIILELTQQQYINLLQLLFDVSDEETDFTNKDFADKWCAEIYTVKPKFR